MKYKATVRLTFDVEFEDNGTDNHRDQAMEAAHLALPSGIDGDIEITHVEPDRAEAPDRTDD